MSLSYPADVLALRSGGEGLGADDGVPPHEGVLLVDIRAPLLGSNHRAVVGRRQAVHARLFVDLDKEYTEIITRRYRQIRRRRNIL